MPNYSSNVPVGTRYRRCRTVTISNGLGDVPYVAFAEEDAVKTDSGGVSTSVSDTCSVRFSPEAVVNMVSPDTLLPTGATFTHADVYNMIFSLYFSTASTRDADRASAEAEAQARAAESARRAEQLKAGMQGG
jgi:hypothetical protein